ncbi:MULTISPECIES: ABC transporter substrate-binding protein [Streptomyces]|uniref:Sugar ABC transporter substrate-binding protein n=1 Tax=Streptomyces evansiae TaxID=3075535 RepID=A0ABD5E6P2_9ACTN|nr:MULTISPECIES: sugar ABC transporter substrate-binding protein [unclassified Streptomyces]ASY34536.1 ABC transporter substrate-binding protein [Streptomyces sp. CLI2509]MDT0417096.1 sugar ABC transporter substrate-binding protein [Streptomyces sp. DSM 41982]MYX24128.1 extracellular solute-binding protein [Streptomyces sp. SID8380]SCD83811.1 carbohydrate ABC transporter substrate-binding protein, CUT1 family [Streptomyces sp. SolWspMP-sol7th]
MSRHGFRSLRALVGAVAAFASLAAVAACGGPSAEAPAEGTRAHPVTVSFWAWTKGSQQVADEFNRTHDTIKVKFEEIPSGGLGGYPKITNALKAGIAPDVLSIEYPSLAQFVSQGSLKDISAYMTPDVKKQFLPQTIELTTMGDKNWAVPSDAAPQVFYYRKDLFEKYGIEPPKTWADFRTAARQVRKAAPEARLATFFADDPSFFQTMAWQAGAQWFSTEGGSWKVDTGDPATKKVAAYWQGMIKDGLVSTAPSYSPEWTSSLKAGTTLGYLGASWSAGTLAGIVPEQKGKWAAMPMPSWDAARPSSGMSQGSTFAISKDSRKTKAAMEFILWMSTSPDSIKARVTASTSTAFPAARALVPVARKAIDTSFYGGADLYGLYEKSAATINPDWLWGPTAAANNTLHDQLQAVVSGEKSLTGAVATTQRATVDALRKSGLKVEDGS